MNRTIKMPPLSALYVIGNRIQKLCDAAGPVLGVELRMRIIGEYSSEVRIEFKKLVDLEHKSRLINNKNAKKESDKYWECNLSFLDNAIDNVFGKKLTMNERSVLTSFRVIRNSFIHVDFVKLMKKLKIIPKSRLQLGKTPNLLKNNEITEAIQRLDNEGGFSLVITHANNVIVILERIIKEL